MMIGGSISNSSFTEGDGGNDFRTGTFSFSPSFGYFVADNLAVGARLSLSSGYSEINDIRNNNSAFTFGPFVRYYKFTSNEQFAFFGDASILIGGGKQENGQNDPNKTGVFRFAISPGFTYFFTQHWALDLSIAGISFQAFDPNKENDGDEERSFSFDINSLSPNLGIRYHFGK
jgi:opacity protein-like surface antigen